MITLLNQTNDGSLLRRIRRLTNPVAAHRFAGWGAAGSLGALLLLGIAGVAVTGAQGQSQPVVDLHTVWSDTVKQGDMKLEVRGLGHLTSDQRCEVHYRLALPLRAGPPQLLMPISSRAPNTKPLPTRRTCAPPRG